MKKVLILGVNGFIGHHLSQRILDTTDWEVYGMDMYSGRVTDLMAKPRVNMADALKHIYEAYRGQVAEARRLTD